MLSSYLRWETFPFISWSALTTALLASLTFSCIILQVQTSQQVHACPYCGRFLILLNLALAFTLQHLTPFLLSSTLTCVSSSAPPSSPLQRLIHRAIRHSAIVTCSGKGSLPQPRIFDAEGPCFKAEFLTVCHPLLTHIQLCKSNSSGLRAEAGVPVPSRFLLLPALPIVHTRRSCRITDHASLLQSLHTPFHPPFLSPKDTAS